MVKERSGKFSKLGILTYCEGEHSAIFSHSELLHSFPFLLSLSPSSSSSPSTLTMEGASPVTLHRAHLLKSVTPSGGVGVLSPNSIGSDFNFGVSLLRESPTLLSATGGGVEV